MIADQIAKANDVARTTRSKQSKLVYEQAVNVSKRGGIEVQTASDVGETKYWKQSGCGRREREGCGLQRRSGKR